MIDPVQPERRVGEIFVDRLLGPGPIAVIVDDQDAAPLQARIERVELLLGALVPVGVEPQ